MGRRERGLRVAAVVLAVLAATAPAVAVTDADAVVQATDGLVVDTPRHKTTGGLQA